MRTRHICLIAALAGLLALAAVTAAAAPPLVVTVRSEATVDTADVHLGQVATLDGGTDAQRQALAALAVGTAPAPAGVRHIDADYLRLCIQRQATVPDGWRLGGAERVVVRRGQMTVTAAQLQRLAVAHVLEHLPYAPENVVIQDVSVAGDVTLPRGRMNIDVRPVGAADYVGIVPLAVAIAVDGRPWRRVLVTVRSEVTVPVVITRRPLARYQTIAAEDLIRTRMDLARLPAGYLQDPESAVGQRVRRTLTAQTVLTDRMIETPPLVRRGDRVRIVAESGPLWISAAGEVRERGRRGERIAVVNLDSRRKIYGRVVDRQTVAIDF